jgi:protein TonB
MRNSLIISFIFHGIIIATAALSASFYNPWQKRLPVYQVELIEAPLKQKPIEAKPVEQPPKSPPKPKPIEIPEKKEQAVSINKTKNLKKKEEKKQEEELKKLEPVDNLNLSQETETANNSEVKIESENFPFVYYLNLLKFRVRENWEPPYQASTKKEKISTIIGFRIKKNGRIESVNIENSSGKYLYDQAAQRAVLTAGPLPPLPQEFSEDFLVVHIEFEALW